MQKSITTNTQNRPLSTKGLVVRTDLRAGFAWDDLDDQALSLWNQLTGAVSNAASSVASAVTDATSGTASS